MTQPVRSIRRPQRHFTTAGTWINDPTGLIHHAGLWHLYFQTNPTGSSWGNMSWGHATSPDLMTWTNHDLAIAADDTEHVYSGSMVCDATDSAGFGAGALVAAYTSAYVSGPHKGHQAQSLAVSTDGGYTFTKFDGNPVLDRSSATFRDPKVFRHGNMWRMVVVEASDNAVHFYSSADLRSWEWTGEYRNLAWASPAWECPDLFALPTPEGDERWVLVVSVNPGGQAGGSGTRYVIGSFDEGTFTADDPATGGPQDVDGSLWLDWGRDFYAATSFNDAPDGRRVIMGWMSNWDYAAEVPSVPWRGSMAIPRDLSLARVDGRLVVEQTPVLAADRRGLRLANLSTSGQLETVRLPTLCDVEVEFDLSEADGAVLHVGQIQIGITKDEIWLDRTRSPKSDFHPGFASVSKFTWPFESPVKLRVLLDTHSIEVFADGGVATLTDLVLWESDPGALTIQALGGTVRCPSLAVLTPKMPTV